MKKLMVILFIVFLTGYAYANDEEVSVRTLLKGKSQTSWHDDSKNVYRFSVPNWNSESFFSIHYLGVETRTSDWFVWEGNTGLTAGKDEKTSAIARLDATLIPGDFMYFNSFVEYYFRPKVVGVFNELAFNYKEYLAGFQNYTSFDLNSDKDNSYSFGPYLGLDFSKKAPIGLDVDQLSLNVHYRWHAVPETRDILIDLIYVVQ